VSQPFLGEIRCFSFSFAPRGWGMCNGQTLPISQNQALFSLLGTTYGGDGTTTFNLPDLRGQGAVGIGQGSGLSLYNLGERVGSETVTLIGAELGAHTHAASAQSAKATSATPLGNIWAGASGNRYGSPANATMDPATIGPAGGAQPHLNLSPLLTLNYCIALNGIYPSGP
jgi:microcystin-dependent protein